jgi:hypothetical protein
MAERLNHLWPSVVASFEFGKERDRLNLFDVGKELTTSDGISRRNQSGS